MSEPEQAAITEDWLRSVGFKWHQLDRQPDKQWLLWLGSALPDDGTLRCTEDLGIELSPVTGDPSRWFCWLRADHAGRYSRFLHVRTLRKKDELTTLIAALTGQAWEPQNNLWGAMRTPAEAALLRRKDDRLDRQILLQRPWSETEKDPTMGGALPEHLEAHEQRKRS